MYGCLDWLASEGKEEEEEEEVREAGQALPPTANLLSLRVRHCSLSHQSPTCLDTHRPGFTLKRLLLLSCFFLFLWLSVHSLVHALLLVSALKHTREEGVRGGASRGRGIEGPCVKTEKSDPMPCGQTDCYKPNQM